jgi:predicted dehydrogenase
MALSWQKMVRDGKLGKILFVEGHYLHAMGEDRFWVDVETGKTLTWAEKADNPNAVKSRFWTLRHPIFYGPHELSPLLKILDDRVVRVCCFSTRTESYRLEEVPFPGMAEPLTVPDLEVAMMHTQKDTIMRFAAGFSAPASNTHWYHLMGTQGDVETGRGKNEPGKTYFCEAPIIRGNEYSIGRADTTWEFDRMPDTASATGHGGLDYYPAADFVQCILNGKEPDIDVYEAVETAAPVIMAAASAEEGGRVKTVPDFRPGPERAVGQDPKDFFL